MLGAILSLLVVIFIALLNLNRVIVNLTNTIKQKTDDIQDNAKENTEHTLTYYEDLINLMYDRLVDIT